MGEDDKIRRIAIVGCGIAGLAMAACLKVIPTEVEEVVIFDPMNDVLDINMGGSMSLSGGALILDRLGFIEQLRNYGKPICQTRYLTGDAERLLDIDLRQIFHSENHSDPESNPHTFTMRWGALRRLLYECAFVADGHIAGMNHRSVTKIVYRHKRKFSSLSEDLITGKITVYFSNKMFEDNFDLVIGADGVHSTARKFTALPNETLLTAIPFGGMLSGAFGVQETGIRVAQCISPNVSDRSEFEAVAAQESMTETQLLEAAHGLSEGRVQVHVGVGCNAVTMRVGDFQNTHFVLGVAYRDDYRAQDSREDDSHWEQPLHSIHDEIEEKLRRGQFKKFKELHALLDISTRPGGLIYDVGIKDLPLPLRTWSSLSGRVILIGDSCHATAPFLGQGCNQAIQDAFCLSSLLYQHNTGQQLELHRQLQALPTATDAISWWPVRMISSLTRCFWKAVFRFGDVRAVRPTRLQKMVYQYEDRRKFHTAWLSLTARWIGYMDTMTGIWGRLVKCALLRAMGWTGLGQAVFAGPAVPVV